MVAIPPGTAAVLRAVVNAFVVLTLSRLVRAVRFRMLSEDDDCEVWPLCAEIDNANMPMMAKSVDALLFLTVLFRSGF